MLKLITYIAYAAYKYTEIAQKIKRKVVKMGLAYALLIVGLVLLFEGTALWIYQTFNVSLEIVLLSLGFVSVGLAYLLTKI